MVSANSVLSPLPGGIKDRPNWRTCGLNLGLGDLLPPLPNPYHTGYVSKFAARKRDFWLPVYLNNVLCVNHIAYTKVNEILSTALYEKHY